MRTSIMVGHPPIEQVEGMIRSLLQLQIQNTVVAFAFPCLALGGGIVSRMQHEGLTTSELTASLLEWSEDLLVDTSLKGQTGQVAKQFHMVHPRCTRRGTVLHELHGNDEAHDL